MELAVAVKEEEDAEICSVRISGGHLICIVSSESNLLKIGIRILGLGTVLKSISNSLYGRIIICLLENTEIDDRSGLKIDPSCSTVVLISGEVGIIPYAPGSLCQCNCTCYAVAESLCIRICRVVASVVTTGSSSVVAAVVTGVFVLS